jgi:hypothetical protein
MESAPDKKKSGHATGYYISLVQKKKKKLTIDMKLIYLDFKSL